MTVMLHSLPTLCTSCLEGIELFRVTLKKIGMLLDRIKTWGSGVLEYYKRILKILIGESESERILLLTFMSHLLRFKCLMIM